MPLDTNGLAMVYCGQVERPKNKKRCEMDDRKQKWVIWQDEYVSDGKWRHKRRIGTIECTAQEMMRCLLNNYPPGWRKYVECYYGKDAVYAFDVFCKRCGVPALSCNDQWHQADGQYERHCYMAEVVHGDKDKGTVHHQSIISSPARTETPPNRQRPADLAWPIKPLDGQSQLCYNPSTNAVRP